eukprot:scaffold1141_cov333-Pavlova_lutheri.AAC.3
MATKLIKFALSHPWTCSGVHLILHAPPLGRSIYRRERLDQNDPHCLLDPWASYPTLASSLDRLSRSASNHPRIPFWYPSKRKSGLWVRGSRYPQSPEMGLEPMTTRLRALRSTN